MSAVSAASLSRAEAERALPSLLGADHQLGGWLGGGASGHVARVVYEGQAHALKVGPREAIVREYEVGRRIAHPAVIRGESLFEGAGPYAAFSMALLSGGDLVTHVRAQLPPLPAVAGPRRTLPMAFGYEMTDLGQDRYRWCGAEGERRLMALLAPLAHGLAAIHAAGFLHLDIAPANLQVAEGPNGFALKIIDLGLARAIAEVDVADDLAVGSAGYLAPELGGRKLTAAADWYSLGVVLFEALTGERPFDGGGPEVLVRKQSLTAPRVRDVCPDASLPLDTLCACLLDRHPGRRGGFEKILALAEGAGGELAAGSVRG